MKTSFDFRPFEGFYESWENRFRSGDGPGEYSYKPGGPTSLYGTTDMLISRFIINRLDLEDGQRRAWSGVINSFQIPRNGWYRKRYTLHFRSHTAAYAVAALRLIDSSPYYPITKADRAAAKPESTQRWLSSIPWSIIWPSSHIVAGLPAIRIMSGLGPEDDVPGGFLHTWRTWLDSRVHPETGFWSRGWMHRTGLRPILSKEELGGAFHMHFVYEALGREWPLPEKVVDAALQLQQPNGFWDGEVSYCIDLDGLWCLLRSSRNAGGYRADDVRTACLRYLGRAEETLNDKNFVNASYDNSHRLTGALAAVAECALFYPDTVVTDRPWRQSLDTACFI